jgi:valyl-tRNA synthetase
VEDHTSSVPHSDRSKTPIEPMISEQWFVKMKELAGPAIAAVKPKRAEAKSSDSAPPEELPPEITFVPDRFVNTYLHWLENVQDWCISRQLVWGHRIPVWYDEDGNTVALLEDPAPGAKHPKSGKALTRQDDDVLDTWASSWLWPFSTLGWPSKTADLDYFYPTNFLSTDRGIIYLWVARMVMASYEFLGEPPFRTVYIHATVLDEQGRRMSKSLGNGIDPIEMIDKWGVDAVRLTLPLLTNEGQDIKLSPTKFEMGRNFCNKLWNAARLVLGNLGDFESQLAALSPAERRSLAAGNVTELEDCFIEGKLTRLVVDVTDSLERHKFNEAATALYRFTWDELCDWYLEVIKPRLYDKRDGDASRLRVQTTLVRVLDTVLTLFHPIIPFITEEIWQNLRPMVAALHGETPAISLALSEWPKGSRERLFDTQVERFDFLREVTRALRNVRSEHNLERKTALDAVVRVGSQHYLQLMGEREQSIVTGLVNLSKFEIGLGAAKPSPAATVILGGGNEVYVAMGNLIDYKMELLRLDASRAKLVEGVNKLKLKLDNESYVQRAPAAVVQKDRERLSEMAAELERTDKHLAEVRKLAGAAGK